MSLTQGKNTLVFGASLNPQRYSHAAVRMLREYKHEVFALGLRAGDIGDVQVLTGTPQFDSVETITLYMNPVRQKPFYDYLLSLEPKRIIFNPGTENAEFRRLAEEQNIEVVYACTLYMLSLDLY